MTPILQHLAEQQTLSRAQAETAMRTMMQGEAAPEEIAALLMGLRTRGETVEELTGFTAVMRAFARSVEAGTPDAIDIVGTGGDGSKTFNISTAAAFVCAGAGVTVAKHGNTSVSSKCGASDVLRALGVEVNLGPEGVEQCLQEVGLAFLFAVHFHPGMQYVMPVRRVLKSRSFFNILGPMCNPAGVQRYLMGAFSRDVAEKMAHILANLGAKHALVVNAEDGLDEFSLAAPTTVFEIQAGEVAEKRTVMPENHGIARASLSALAGGEAEENAHILRSVLEGETGPRRDVVVLNAAYALAVSGRFADLDACLAAARESLDSGAARAKLDALIATSNNAPTA